MMIVVTIGSKDDDDDRDTRVCSMHHGQQELRACATTPRAGHQLHWHTHWHAPGMNSQAMPCRFGFLRMAFVFSCHSGSFQPLRKMSQFFNRPMNAACKELI
jgi:hypothetical protein